MVALLAHNDLLLSDLCLQPLNTLQVVIAGSASVSFVISLLPQDMIAWHTSSSAAGYQKAGEPIQSYNLPCTLGGDFGNCLTTSNTDKAGLWVICK